jgi:hypothetical protein
LLAGAPIVIARAQYSELRVKNYELRTMNAAWLSAAGHRINQRNHINQKNQSSDNVAKPELTINN